MSLHFLDIGARKGRTVNNLLKDNTLDIKAYLFEPNPIVVKHLRERFATETRITIYKAALTDRIGTIPLYWDEDTGEGASIYFDKKTSIGAPHIDVTCMSARKVIQDLPDDEPIVFYSNCEGSEFEIMEDLFKDDLWKKISLWSIAFHHGDRKIPSMKPAYFRIQKQMDEFGIENVPGHFHKKADIELAEFIEKVKALVP